MLRRQEKATKAAAKQITAELRDDLKRLETGCFALGRKVATAVDRHVPEALGMNMMDWMEDTFSASVSVVFRSLRAFRALKGVPEEKLKEIIQANAVNIARLPEKVRKSDEWVDKAATMPEKVFKEEVAHFIEKRTGIKREKFSTLRISLPKDLYDLGTEAMLKIARILQVDISDASKNQTGALINVWTAIFVLINLTDESRLKVEIEGE